MNVELRREIEFAISDFLAGSPMDAETLALHLAGRKLRIVPDLTDEDATNRIVRNTLDAAQTEIEEISTRQFIDPATREKVAVITVEEAIDAIDNVWSDPE